MMWPPVKAGGWEITPAAESTAHVTASLGDHKKMWTLACEVEGLVLKINGKEALAADANAYGGQSFTMEVGPHLVEFVDKGKGAVDVILNKRSIKQLFE